MTTKGWLISGVAAVAVLFAGGIALVSLSTGGAAAGQAAVDQPAEVPKGTVANASPEARAASQAPPPPSAAPAPELAAPAPALPTSMEDRVRALEPLRLEVMKGLAGHDGRIEACRLRGVELVVTLETLDRHVRVLDVVPRGTDAPSEVSGGVAPPPPDPEAVRCLRGALGRAVLEAPSAAPGRQWQMSYVAGNWP